MLFFSSIFFCDRRPAMAWPAEVSNSSPMTNSPVVPILFYGEEATDGEEVGFGGLPCQRVHSPDRFAGPDDVRSTGRSDGFAGEPSHH